MNRDFIQTLEETQAFASHTASRLLEAAQVSSGSEFRALLNREKNDSKDFLPSIELDNGFCAGRKDQPADTFLADLHHAKFGDKAALQRLYERAQDKTHSDTVWKALRKEFVGGSATHNNLLLPLITALATGDKEALNNPSADKLRDAILTASPTNQRANELLILLSTSPNPGISKFAVDIMSKRSIALPERQKIMDFLLDTFELTGDQNNALSKIFSDSVGTRGIVIDLFKQRESRAREPLSTEAVTKFIRMINNEIGGMDDASPKSTCIDESILKAYPSMSPETRKLFNETIPSLVRLNSKEAYASATTADVQSLVKLAIAIKNDCGQNLRGATGIDQEIFGRRLMGICRETPDNSLSKQAIHALLFFPRVDNTKLSETVRPYLNKNANDHVLVDQLLRTCDLCGWQAPLPFRLNRFAGFDKVPHSELEVLAEKLKARFGERGISEITANIHAFNCLSPTQQTLLTNPDLRGKFDQTLETLRTTSSPLEKINCIQELERLAENEKKQLDPLSVLQSLSNPSNHQFDHLAQPDFAKKLVVLQDGLIKAANAVHHSKMSVLEKFQQDNIELQKTSKEGSVTSNWWLLMPDEYLYQRWGKGQDFDKFSDKQANLLNSVEQDKARVGLLQKLNTLLSAEKNHLELAKDIRDYINAVEWGSRKRADDLAIWAISKYGRIFTSQNAPLISNDFNSTGPLLSERGIFARRSDQDGFHKFRYGTPDVIRDATEALKSPKDHERTTGFDLSDVNKNAALEAVYTDPRVVNLFKSGTQLKTLIDDVEHLFRLGIDNERSKALCHKARFSAQKLTYSLKEFTRQDFEGLRNDLVKFRDALPEHSKEREAAETLCRNLQPLIDLKKDGKLQETIRIINSGQFDESTFLQWARTDGLKLAMVVGACTLAALTMGQGTPLAIQAMLYAIACNAADMTSDQIAKWTGGSAYGDRIWEALNGQNWQIKDGEVLHGPSVREAIVERGKHVYLDATVNLALMGFGRLITRGLQGATPEHFSKQIVALEKALKSPGLANQVQRLALAATQDVTQQTVFILSQKLTEQALKDTGVEGKVAGLVATLLLIGGTHAIQGLKARSLKNGNRSENFIEHNFSGDQEALLQKLHESGVPSTQRDGKIFLKFGSAEIELRQSLKAAHDAANEQLQKRIEVAEADLKKALEQARREPVVLQQLETLSKLCERLKTIDLSITDDRNIQIQMIETAVLGGRARKSLDTVESNLLGKLNNKGLDLKNFLEHQLENCQARRNAATNPDATLEELLAFPAIKNKVQRSLNELESLKKAANGMGGEENKRMFRVTTEDPERPFKKVFSEANPDEPQKLAIEFIQSVIANRKTLQEAGVSNRHLEAIIEKFNSEIWSEFAEAPDLKLTTLWKTPIRKGFEREFTKLPEGLEKIPEVARAKILKKLKLGTGSQSENDSGKKSFFKSVTEGYEKDTFMYINFDAGNKSIGSKKGYFGVVDKNGELGTELHFIFENGFAIDLKFKPTTDLAVPTNLHDANARARFIEFMKKPTSEKQRTELHKFIKTIDPKSPVENWIPHVQNWAMGELKKFGFSDHESLRAFLDQIFPKRP